MMNSLAKHQAVLLQKQSYNHLEQSQDQNQFSLFIQAKGIGMSPEQNGLRATKVKFSESSLDQIQQENERLQKNYIPHSRLQTSAMKRGERTKALLPLANHQNTYFTGQISVGDIKDEFKIIFDTGSSLTFINSNHCDAKGCSKGSQYNSEGSDTHQSMNAQVEVEFGSGTLNGNLAKETFFVNGMEIPETLFIEITEEKGDVFETGDFEGIVGLSFPDLADDMPTLFDFMMNEELVEKNVFSFYLNRQSNTQNSKIIFGGYDENLLLSEIKYHDVVEESYWMIYCEQILVGDEDIGICSKQNPCKMVVDSGTSLFTGPSDQLPKILEKLDNGGDGCKNLYDLPPITFVMGGVKYPIYPEEYVLTVTNSGIESPHKHSDIGQVIQCIGAFYALDIDQPSGPLWVLGDVFMSKYYSVFDRGSSGQGSRVGFGLANIPDNKNKHQRSL